MGAEANQRTSAVGRGEVRAGQPIAVDRLVLDVDGGGERFGFGHGAGAVRTACEAAMLASVAAVAPDRARTAAARNTGTDERTSV